MPAMKKTLFSLIAIILFSHTGTSIASAFEQDSLVRKKCTRCHRADETGKIPRVEDIRTSPEEWTVIVDRMHRLYNMSIKTGEMAVLLKELCRTQILTPAEAAGVAYIDLFNNPQTIETPNGADEVKLFATCVRCHSAAKIYSYRMTESSWQKLRDFHIYIDPAIIYQMREMYWRSEAETVLNKLAEELLYKNAWMTPEASPEGEWLVLGMEPGKGSYRGKIQLTAKGYDEFAMQGMLSFSDQSTESFTGEATLYGGYALRTRSRRNGNASMGAFRFTDGTISGAHHYSAPDFRTSSSSWYPVTDQSRVLRASPAYLLSGEQTTILVEGINLPDVSAEDIAFSTAGVEVIQAGTTSTESVELILIYHGSSHGSVDMSIKGLESMPLKLAPGIDYLRLSPETGRARVNGGINYPAEGVQFQAFAYSAGEDKQEPSDDYLLGPVAADFSLAEEETRPDDDDLAYVGAIEKDGTYLPSGDYNPIPAREYGGEGTGMVKVMATYARGDAAYSAEARLVVTVPDYIQRIK
jgi:quinohemoprotein amine dehydrogenase